MNIFRNKYLIAALKIAALIFMGGMVAILLPELVYDFGPKQPLTISGPEDLLAKRPKGTVFASLQGSPDFTRAFVYPRYGLRPTYFTLKSYDMLVVVRTYEEVNADWKSIERFLGKLRPFHRQPFHYRIRDIYKERFELNVPENAYFLAMDDVPKVGGWNIAAFIFSCVLWLAMFFFFLIFPRRGKRPPA